MSESNELKKIKKVYGEKFMHFCREEFSTILEREGLLYEILAKYFSDNCRTLYEDLEKEKIKEGFRDFIYEKVDNYFNFNVKYEEKIEERNPYQILDEAGYELYECKTEEEIQNYRKYYIPTEELCTFRGGRLKRCVVFWAVKKNVDEIRREDFKNPRREDEYGTSVMSIQFERHGTCTVSIKNRYNHTLKNNPDATYGNDLDKIAPGLRESFTILLRKEYGLELDNINIEQFSMPKGYVIANDRRYYKYNIEINGKYYCPGNIVIENGEPKKIENPESQILIDYFILDIKNKTIRLYDEKIEDSFIEEFQNLEDAKIRVEKNKEKGTRKITIEKAEEKDIIIEIDKNNQIVGYRNENLKEIGDNFLYYNKKLINLELHNLLKVGNSFLYNNIALTNLNLPNLRKIGDNFLFYNEKLSNLELLSLKEVKNKFLDSNIKLKKLELQNLQKIGYRFLHCNEGLKIINLPNLEEVGDDFLYWNRSLKKIELPKLRKVENSFLYNNITLTNLNLPNLREVGDCFLFFHIMLTTLELPNLEKAGNRFLFDNIELINVNLPNLREVGDNFLRNNTKLKNLELPNLEKVGKNFLFENKDLTNLKLLNLEKVGDRFLYCNEALRSLELPNLRVTEGSFLYRNAVLVNLKLPKVEKLGYSFLYNNKGLINLELLSLKEVEDYFLYNNRNLTTLELPNLEKVRNNFLLENKELTSLSFPKLREIENDFLVKNEKLQTLELPNLEKVGNRFLSFNKGLTILEVPNLREVGGDFLYNNKKVLVNFEIPNNPKLDEQLKSQGFSIKDFVKNAVVEGVGVKKVKKIEKELKLNEEKDNCSR